MMNPNETWKNYIVDTIQLAALVTVIGVILYCVDSLLNWSK